MTETAQTRAMNFWTSLNGARRYGLVLGAMGCLGLTALLGYWALNQEYEPVFSQLTAVDAAAVVSQLKREKVPYQLAEEGSAVLVPRGIVQDARLSLMSSSMPLGGGVGFEIFDRQGLGATEQSQRVSFQRALQGELARTINALDPVLQSRVHLVIPDGGLFRRDRQEGRAAVVLAVQEGAALGREQIVGIQRMVAHSVPSLDPARVVVTDQHGRTLSPMDPSGGASSSADSRLTIKQDIEQYIAEKIGLVLEGAYGSARVVVSVDVTLGFDEVRRTRQDVLGAGADGPGIISRRESAVSYPGSDQRILDTDAGSLNTPSVTESEVQYERGRQTEEYVSAPGNVLRLSVGIMLPFEIDDHERDALISLIGAAAGTDSTRGDTIVVSSFPRSTSSWPEGAPASDVAEMTAPFVGSQGISLSIPVGFSSASLGFPLLGVVGLLLFGLLLVAVLFRVLFSGRRLSERERAMLAKELEEFLLSQPAAVRREAVR